MIQVTAITAAYNAASYIENCIQSVLAQTVPTTSAGFKSYRN